MGRKGKERDPGIYKRLVESSSSSPSSSSAEFTEDRAPKGHIPVLVGKEGMMERFLVHVSVFSDPRIVVLLEMAADELGYQQEGILRIPCDANHFRQLVSVISKAK